CGRSAITRLISVVLPQPGRPVSRIFSVTGAPVSMLFASEPSKTQAVVFLQRRLSSEWRAEVVKDIAKPAGIAGRCLLQAKAPHLQGDEPRRSELTIARLDIHQIHQRQITPKFFVT